MVGKLQLIAATLRGRESTATRDLKSTEACVFLNQATGIMLLHLSTSGQNSWERRGYKIAETMRVSPISTFLIMNTAVAFEPFVLVL